MDLHALGRQAMALHQQGRLADAEALYRQILAIDARVFPALYLLGMVRLTQGDHAEAAELTGRALAINPNDPGALLHHGLALHGQARFADAAATYDRLLALQPGLTAALMGRGASLRAMGQTQAALADHEAVLVADPGNADAWNGRGALLAVLGRSDEAMESCDRALALRPDFAEALNNRGEMFWNRKEYAQALADLTRALELEPGRSRLGDKLLQLRMVMALDACDWAAADAIAARLPARVAAGESVSPYLMLLYSSDEDLQLQAARNFTAAHFPARPALATTTQSGDRIRLAYVSPDFSQHPVAAQIVEVLERHDRSRFEVLAISTGRDDGSDMRRRLAAATTFHDLQGLSPRAVAERMQALGVDIAVDLNGHVESGHLEIFAWRPAPVQATWLGYPGTTGATFIDHVIADTIATPHDQAFSEKIVRMPHSFFPLDTRRTVAPAPGRAEMGLPQDGFVFCSFNSHWKIGGGLFALWMRLLAQVPGSVLWQRQPNDDAAAVLRAAAAAHGVDPARLVFAPPLPLEQHLARHAVADLFLDTLPYNAHSSACDALWNGLPVLTCRGDSFAGRVGASLLAAAGLPELIAEDRTGYEALALKLARNPATMAALKQKLIANRATAPLFDMTRFTRDLEALYRTMISG